MKQRSPITVVAVNDEQDPEFSLRQFLLANLGPWGSSAVAHAAILIILLLWTIPIMQQGGLELTAFTGVDEGEIEEMAFALDDSTGADSEQDENDPRPPIDLFDTAVDEAPMELVEPELEFSAPVLDDGLRVVDQTSAVVSSGGSVGEADSVEEAVDRITGGIQGRLEQGDVLVVWLLDSSLSLKDDRQRVAQRLKTFLEETNEGNANEHKLLNAVAIFGRSFKETVSPTTSSQAVLHSIRNAAVDTSGKENVFLAVEKCIAKYRQRWKSQMMIVIWTDESGDDDERLIQTVARAKQAKVAVSVVGQSAVLGSAAALLDWTDPKTGRFHQLPIRNGPDSAMHERLRLSYWFRGPPPRRIRGERRGFPNWYGNGDLIGLSSSFSPWALTRLATETGGSYTLFDRTEDRAPYDAERMKAYRPSYASLRDYRKKLAQHPLRNAVHQAVAVSYTEDIATPSLMFFGLKSPNPPHAIQPLYFTPREFRSKLNSSRGKVSRQIKHASYAIEKALAHVSDPEVLEEGLEYAYNNETSPRWKAWYDLTRGRLLATSVRLEEYRIAFDNAVQRDALRSTTNGLVFGPSTDMRSEGKYVERAAEAARLLHRCVQDNPDTPWEFLAERELTHGLGIQLRQMSYTPTGTMSEQSDSKIPRF